MNEVSELASVEAVVVAIVNDVRGMEIAAN
jgi:hypothetical protein